MLLQRKFLPLLLLLLASAVLSTNVHYARAQHHTIDFAIDPCGTACKINIRNGTGAGTINANYTNGMSAVFEDGPYNITAYPAPTYTFKNWSYTAGIKAQSNVTNPTNITLSGTATSTLTAAFNLAVPTIQPNTILFFALLTTAIPVLLRRARKPIVSV